MRPLDSVSNSHVGKRQLESCVLLPPGYEPGQSYPVIVEVYPSRGGNCTSPAARRYNSLGRRPGPYSEHLLAAKGYIVFKPNTSREVTRTAAGPLGGMTDIVLQGVDALVEQGYADSDRIGLLGFSQGGFSSLWRYWGEGHGPSSPGNIRHMWNEILQWYDRYVLEVDIE